MQLVKIELVHFQYLPKINQPTETIVDFLKPGILETENAIQIQLHPDSFQSFVTTLQLLAIDLADMMFA